MKRGQVCARTLCALGLCVRLDSVWSWTPVRLEEDIMVRSNGYLDGNNFGHSLGRCALGTLCVLG